MGGNIVWDSLAATCHVTGLSAGSRVVGLTRLEGLGIRALWVAGHGYRKGPLNVLGDMKPGSAPRVPESAL